MNSDPISTALRHVSETRGMVEALIISSERFDYPKAKTALRRLEKKVKQLGKLQARLESARSNAEFKVTDSKICRVDFQNSSSAANQ